MNKVASSYWVDARFTARNSATHTFAPATTTGARAATRSRAKARRANVSSFAVFGMVIVTMFALCLTVTLRTHAEAQTAASHHASVNAEVEALRDTNTELLRRVEQLRTDPRAIETAARERLGMVRPSDVIVPVE